MLKTSAQVDAASSRVETAQSCLSESARLEAASTQVGYFDPKETIDNLCGNLPHWRQPGTTYFVTFRLADSLPQQLLQQWLHERDEWCKANPKPHTPQQQHEFQRLFPNRFQYWLDQGYGSCVLGEPEVKGMVENSLRHFAGTRYALDEFIVMPNHVHAVVTPIADYELSRILHSWKSFTANQVNRRRGTSGALWQKESFDHIVRSPDSLERIRQYIRNNPLGVAVRGE